MILFADITGGLTILVLGLGFIGFLFWVAKTGDQMVMVCSGWGPKNNYTVYQRKDGSRYQVYKYSGEVVEILPPAE